MLRNVSVRPRTLKRYLYGSVTRYCTIHSTTATLRSPVSITDSPANDAAEYRDRMPGSVVRNPNSSLSWRWTGTRVTDSMNGILTLRPGSVVRTYRPKRSTTPTSSGLTWKATFASATIATSATTAILSNCGVAHVGFCMRLRSLRSGRQLSGPLGRSSIVHEYSFRMKQGYQRSAWHVRLSVPPELPHEVDHREADDLADADAVSGHRNLRYRNVLKFARQVVMNAWVIPEAR